MPTELEELIAAYQQEVKNLEREINECLELGFYWEAHHLSEAMGATKRILQTLENLENPNRDRIRTCQLMIHGILKRKSSDTLMEDEYWDRRIQKYKGEIERLSVKLPKQHEDHQVIYDYLKELYSKKIKGLLLHIDLSHQLQFEIRVSNDDLLILTLTVEGINSTFDYFSLPKEKLRMIGFCLEGGSWTITIDTDHGKDFGQVYECLSRVMFEAFYFQEIKEKVSLEIIV